MILFAKDPLSFFDGAYVQYVRYDGDSSAADVLLERRSLIEWIFEPLLSLARRV